MNFSLVFLSVSNLEKTPFISLTKTERKRNFIIENSYFSKTFSNFIFISQFSTNFFIKKTKFSYSLDSAIRISNKFNNITFVTKNIIQNYPINYSISSSFFFHCETANKNGGGALFCLDPQGSLIITHSTFQFCSTKQQQSNGGALLILGGKCDTRVISCCFKQCYASFSGQAIFIESQLCFSVLNQTTISDCPSIYTSLQSSSAAFICDHMTECVNQTNSKCDKNPALLIRGLQICMLHYLSLINNTSVYGGSIYEIGHTKNPQFVNAGCWNVIGCFGDYYAIGIYRVVDMIQSYMTIINTEKNVLCCLSGHVTLQSCIFDKKLHIIAPKQILACIIQEECKVVRSPHPYKMSKTFDSCCFFEQKGKIYNYTLTTSFIVLSAALGIISAALLKLYIKAHQRRNEKLYQQLAIPDIE